MAAALGRSGTATRARCSSGRRCIDADDAGRCREVREGREARCDDGRGWRAGEDRGRAGRNARERNGPRSLLVSSHKTTKVPSSFTS